MTPKQERFVQEYLIDLNATQAAVRAGYSKKTASEQGTRLLGNVRVQATLQEAIKKRSARTEITQDAVLEELRGIAFAKITDVAEWGETVLRQENMDGSVIEVPYHGLKVKNSRDLPGDAATAVAEVSEGKYGVQVKMHSKVQALQLLGKHLGMFVDRQEVSVVQPPKIVVELSGE